MKPRSFHAMREDRVRAMAQSRFGREFGSKADAVEALARLPVAEQHALKKPRAGTVKTAAPKATKPPSAWARNADAIRGGIKPPSADKLARAALEKPAVLARYARAAVTIEPKSPLQALVVLSNHGGSKRLKRAAGEAFGMFKNGHLAGRIGEVSSGAQAMAKSLDDTLKGLSKADAIRLAEQVGAGSHKTKAAAIKAIGTESLRQSHQAHKSVIASNSSIFGTRPQLEGSALSSAAQAAGRKARAAFDGKVAQALASKMPSAAPVSVSALAAKVEKAIASGDKALISATRAEIAGAKLGKAAAQELAKASGLPVAASASGKVALGRVLGRLDNMSTMLSKVAAIGGKSAAGLAITAGVAAIAMMASARSNGAHAADAKPASADVRDGGDIAAAASLTLAGAGIAVSGIRNTSIADKAKALRDSLTTRAAERTAAATAATEKAGRTAGLLDKLFRPGKVPGINARAAIAAERATANTTIAGRLAAIAGKPGGIEGHLISQHNAKIATATGLSRTGAAIAGAILRNPGKTGVAMMAAGIAGLYVAQQARTKPGGAYLNDAAAAKAATTAPASAPAGGGRDAAQTTRPDGETAGYTRQRRTASGLVIQEQVSSYRTPTR